MQAVFWPSWLYLFCFAVQLSDQENVSLYSSWLLLIESQWILPSLFPVTHPWWSDCNTSLNGLLSNEHWNDSIVCRSEKASVVLSWKWYKFCGHKPTCFLVLISLNKMAHLVLPLTSLRNAYLLLQTVSEFGALCTFQPQICLKTTEKICLRPTA